MGSIALTGIETLSFQRTLNYWGDIFHCNSTDVYTVQSRVRNTGDFEYSVAPIYDKIGQLTSTGLSYYGFTIDGVNVGTGRITSFNWDEGTDVIDKPYSMTFEVYESGNLLNLAGILYSDIDKTIFNSGFNFVQNFQENVSISLSQSKIQETTQSVSFEIDGDLSDPQKINLKNTIFSGFAQFRIPQYLGIRTLYPNIISGNLQSGYISYFNETFDLFNGSFSFQKQSFYDNDQKATWNYSHTVQLNGNDLTVTEDGSVRSIYFEGISGSRNLSGARQRWENVQTGIFGRVSGLYATLSGFSGLFSSGSFCGLFDVPLDKRYQENPMEGLIDYSYSYSNNPAYANSGYIFENSRSSLHDEDGYFTVSENGEYRGIGLEPEVRFNNASGAFYSGVQGILPRISGTFLLAAHLDLMSCALTGNFRLMNESTTYREYDGIISYNYEYSNNPSYYPSGSIFIKYKNTVTDNQPVHLHNRFLVPRQNEYSQSSNQSTEGSWINSIQIIGKPDTILSQYLQEAYTKVLKPTGSGVSDVFLKDMSYSFNPFENTFESSFEYYYSRYKESEDILV